MDAEMGCCGWEDEPETTNHDAFTGNTPDPPCMGRWGEEKENPAGGDKRFHALLAEIGDLHDRKQQDYGSDTDPFANVRASEEWGVPGWVGALVRLNDKVHRLKVLSRKKGEGGLANESAEDSMMDIAVYALIALILYREEYR